jgi:hypothetical protein
MVWPPSGWWWAIRTTGVLNACAPRVDVVEQSLIRPFLLARQPFEGFVSKETRNEGVDDLLQRKYEPRFELATLPFRRLG